MTESENKEFKKAKTAALNALGEVKPKPKNKGAKFFDPSALSSSALEKQISKIRKNVKETESMDQLKSALEEAMTVSIDVWKKVFPTETPKRYSIALVYSSDSE